MCQLYKWNKKKKDIASKRIITHLRKYGII